jgi:Holliday junction DNA helicase RuvB
MGGNLTKPEDIQALLAPLSDKGGDIVFIDEIHRMPIAIEEMLYTAMEDFELEMDLGKGTKRYWIPTFTLIGATTLAGDLSRPLRDRFGQHFQLQNYQVDEVSQILSKLAKREQVTISDDAINEIAKRGKGVARIAINLFYRCLEMADYLGDGTINEDTTAKQFAIMGLDEMGLDENDYVVLNYLASQPRPIGAKALASACNMDETTITNIIEPYLVQKGMVNRTQRGREITPKGLSWIGATPPEEVDELPVQSNNRRDGIERLR